MGRGTRVELDTRRTHFTLLNESWPDPSISNCVGHWGRPFLRREPVTTLWYTGKNFWKRSEFTVFQDLIITYLFTYLSRLERSPYVHRTVSNGQWSERDGPIGISWSFLLCIINYSPGPMIPSRTQISEDQQLLYSPRVEDLQRILRMTVSFYETIRTPHLNEHLFS